MSLPDIEVPVAPGEPIEGYVDVIVRVDVDGSARVEDCQVSDAVCERVADAISRARFEPATRDGTAIAARVRVALHWASAQTTAGTGTGTGSQSEPPDAGTAGDQTWQTQSEADAGAASGDTPRSDSEPASFGARARVRPAVAGMRRLELSEMRDLPGAFGDPFRAVDALPGVVPAISGLPYFYVRGSPPAGTLYVYDDIPMPTLYHLAAGPAVIHPRMVGPIQLYAGVAPARYGRLTGGVVVGEGPAEPDGRTHAEAELRLLDVSAFLQTPALGGTFTGAFRYGYPGLLLSVFSPEVDLAYWDYQLRYASDVRARDRIELVALGSYDSISVENERDSDVRITFHRVEARAIHRVGRTTYGAALLFGWEESTLGSGFSLQSTRVAPRFWVERRLSETSRLRISGDMTGVAGTFSSDLTADGPDGGLGQDRLFASIPARTIWGLQGELELRPWRALELKLGVRGDAWVQLGGLEAVLDPRVRVVLHPDERVQLHVAAGVVHQPAVFFLPLPGIEDVAMSRGLQAAIQSEAGIGWDTPLDLRLETQLFVHRYQNLVFTDVLFLRDALESVCSAIHCGNVSVPDRIDGTSYGAELFVRRTPDHALSGWLSYTLAWSQVHDIAGLPYTPTWDVRHVLNLVGQWNLGGGFSVGARLHARSGKMNGDYIVDPGGLRLLRDEHRLPWFVRIDLQAAYAWTTSWGRMRIALEWFNATLSHEPIEVQCDGSPRTCHTRYLPAIFFPNLSLRAEL